MAALILRNFVAVKAKQELFKHFVLDLNQENDSLCYYLHILTIK